MKIKMLAVLVLVSFVNLGFPASAQAEFFGEIGFGMNPMMMNPMMMNPMMMNPMMMNPMMMNPMMMNPMMNPYRLGEMAWVSPPMINMSMAPGFYGNPYLMAGGYPMMEGQLGFRAF